MAATWDEDETYLVIGIDFGTTFSGIAWALSNKPKDVDIITGWDSELDHNEGSAKVPTRISYSSDGRVSSWGFDHDVNDHQLSWFKLLLCEETKKRASFQRSFLSNLEADMKAMNKTPVNVVADFLQRLWEHATSTLKSRFGATFFDNLQIKLVLTIPAIWDHQAQELTRRAAQKAGMMKRGNIKLELVSEPEAAARFVFGENLAMQVGDAFVVCDAGGGTIDLISYEVEQLQPLRLKMCSEATGDLYGAVFLDSAFERTVRANIGPSTYDGLSVRNRRKMMGDWEHGIKRGFKHGQRPDKNWVVDIPGYAGMPTNPPPYTPQQASSWRSVAQSTESSIDGQVRALNISGRRGIGAEPGQMNLKTTDLEAIFGEVCPRVTQLVREQVFALKRISNRSPKAIFLVGGFGASKYLKEELQISFNGIEIQQPRDAWTAICRGAVLKGMSDETVVNHIAKYHYGIHFQERFDNQRHESQDKVWDMIECEWKAQNQMRWYVSRGDNISKTKPVRYNWYLTITDPSRLNNIQTTIYYCTPLVAPKRRSADVKRLCKLTANFDNGVWDELMEKMNSNGMKYRTLRYSIEMKVSSSGLDWSLHYEGQEKGRATIAIDYAGEVPRPEF